MIFFPPARDLPQFLTLLQQMLGNRKIVLAIDMTRSTEKILRGRVQQLLSRKPGPEQASHVAVVVEGAKSKRKISKRQTR